MSQDVIVVDMIVEKNNRGNHYMEFKERNGYLIGLISVIVCIIASVWTIMSFRRHHMNPNGKNES